MAVQVEQPLGLRSHLAEQLRHDRFVEPDQLVLVDTRDCAENPLAQPPSTGDCDVEQTRIPRTAAADIVFVMVPADCELAVQAAGNGSYGYYRTVDDVADGQVVEIVRTGIGTATIVDVPYYECTNSCVDGVIRMALIEVQDPANPAYATLQVYQPVLISSGQQQDLDIAGYVDAIMPA